MRLFVCNFKHCDVKITGKIDVIVIDLVFNGIGQNPRILNQWIQWCLFKILASAWKEGILDHFIIGFNVNLIQGIRGVAKHPGRIARIRRVDCKPLLLLVQGRKEKISSIILILFDVKKVVEKIRQMKVIVGKGQWFVSYKEKFEIFKTTGCPNMFGTGWMQYSEAQKFASEDYKFYEKMYSAP